jgi:hypothetical protein
MRLATVIAPVVIALALANACYLAAQVPADQDPIFWDGGRVIRMNPMDHTITVEDGGLPSKPPVTLDVKFRGEPLGPAFNVHAGRYWVTHRSVAAEDAPDIEVHSSVDGKAWQREGYALRESAQGWIQNIIHLSGDYFIFETIHGFRDGAKSSPLALGKKDAHGVIKFEKLLDLQIDKSWLAQDKSGAWEKNFKDLLYAIISFGFLGRTDDKVIYGSGYPGFLWVVGAEGGSPSIKLAKLYPSEGLSPGAKGHLTHCLLGIQPTADGHFLVASRSLDAVLHADGGAADAWPATSGTPAKEKLRTEFAAKAEANGLIRYPEILWWDFDPGTGNFRKEATPMGAPGQISSVEGLSRFRFRITPKGQVVCEL